MNPHGRELPTRTVTILAAALLVVAVSTACQRGDEPGTQTLRAGVPLLEGLGTHHHTITTRVPVAQHYFDQGIRLVYAFNHAEAIRAFEEAERLDPSCAMCGWGIAWASGPNINAPMDSANGARAYAAIQRALKLANEVSDKERAYIDAMAVRYGPDPTTGRARRDSAYARAMAKVADAYPDDPDAQVLAGEAIMLLSPWDYWTEDDQPKPSTEQLLARLEPVTERYPEHAGACHFYIHAVEKAYPQRAIPCAERIAQLMPAAGHVVHMPSHIYIRVGRYADAVEANEHAVHADEAYIGDGPRGTAYTLAYYPHNYHFLSFAATMAGQKKLALKSARRLAEEVDQTMMREPGLGALQHFLVTPLRVMVRFGLWEEILEEPAPPADLPYTQGTYRYARGMALARSGQLDAAEAEVTHLRGLIADPALDAVTVWDLNSGRSLLQIGERVLTGEIAAARGDQVAAVAALQEGVRLETKLTYDEPPPWDLPVRNFLGAVLLESGRPAEAEAVYQKELERFPDNGWTLRGLVQSHEVQRESADAEAARERLRTAWRKADVELPGSRY